MWEEKESKKMAIRKESASARIKKALEINSMKQAELSRRTGIDKGTISLYISGKYEPRSNKAVLLAEALGTSPEWIMGFDVPIHKEKSSPELSEEEKGLLELFRGLPEDKQKMVLEMLKAALSTK